MPLQDKKDGGSKWKKERRTEDTFFGLPGVVLLDFLLLWSVAGCTTVDCGLLLFTLLQLWTFLLSTNVNREAPI